MTLPPLILVVDDDEAICSSLGRLLRLVPFRVQTAQTAEQALACVARQPPDAAVIDVVLPGEDGVWLTRRLRAGGHDLPICILSAREEVDDRVGGLEAGADDYLVKPFVPEELVARLRAMLRRTPDGGRITREVGDLWIEPSTRRARRAGRDLALTRREFDLLEVLARNAGVVLTRAQLLEQVWGYGAAVDGNVVDLFVSYLRRKLEAAGEPRLVHTVRGVGFVLRVEG